MCPTVGVLCSPDFWCYYPDIKQEVSGLDRAPRRPFFLDAPLYTFVQNQDTRKVQ